MYKIICHWSRLDWHFPNAVMQEEFETNQSWKAMPAGVKVDHQGQYYVSVPRLAHGIPATMNRIVVKEGSRCLTPFRVGTSIKLET